MCPDDNEFQELLDRLCDGELDAVQQQRLAELLEDSPARQQEYLEYLDLHARMKSKQVRDLPTIKSLTLQQVTVEFNDPGGAQSLPAERVASKRIAGPGSSRRVTIAFVLLGLLVAIVALWSVLKSRQPLEGKVMATVKEVSPQSLLSTWVPGDELREGVHQIPAGKLQIELLNQVAITLEGPTSLRLYQGDHIFVEKGKLQVRASKSEGKVKLQYGDIVLDGTGADFDIDPATADSNIISLSVSTGTVVMQTPNAQPRHLWDFEGSGQQVRDKAGEAHGKLSVGTKRVPGIVGRGTAVEFDNTHDAAIAVGSGGGEALGTGTFAVDDGITLEAFIQPRWSGRGFSTGEAKNYDEILRKEGDGELRFLLSFQNDNPEANNYSQPEQQPGPVLAFGLYLIGPGYQELEVPLEGEHAPITLADLKDGRTHHIAAIYKTSTGRKEIYVDGNQVAFQQYPVGTRPLTGGPGEVVIGNLSPAGESASEPFDGILDDVAFYDFALPVPAIRRHAESREAATEQSHFRSRDTYDYDTSAGNRTLIDLSIGLPLETSPLQSSAMGRSR